MRWKGGRTTQNDIACYLEIYYVFLKEIKKSFIMLMSL